MSSEDTPADYKPSPYSSILPRVQLSKTKPLIQVVDVPPAAADDCSRDANFTEQDVNLQTADQIDSESDAVAVPIERLIDETGNAESSDQQSRNKNLVQVISTTSTNPRPDTYATSTTPTQSICSTCTKNIARYTCPKCSAPYCSVSCYKIHDGSVKSNNEKVCTESFYKDRVLGEYHARGSEEDKLKLRGILNRMHQDIGMHMDDVEWREDSLSRLLKEDGISGLNGDVLSELNQYDERLAAANLGGAADHISDEELAELASYILNLEEEEDQDADPQARVQQLKETMPPHLLNAFECALASALEAECKGDDEEEGLNLMSERNKQQVKVNATWQPWWLPETNQSLDTTIDFTAAPNLDERILSIRPLPSLISQTNNRNLAHNILDVLYATSFALRTASSVGAAENTADLLIAQSLVLSENAIYESVQASMSACAEKFVEVNKTIHIRTDLSWNILASDISIVSSNRRYVLRMLFEAADILDSGIELLKVHSKVLKKKEKSAYEEKKSELDEIKRQYKLALKKVEYFQSWCSSMWNVDMGQEISEEIDSFVEHWKMPEKEEKTPHIESILGSMLSKDGSSDTNSIKDNAFGMLEVAHKDNHFRLGKELVAVSSTQK